jgi:hypothetical protein
MDGAFWSNIEFIDDEDADGGSLGRTKMNEEQMRINDFFENYQETGRLDDFDIFEESLSVDERGDV